MPVLLLHGALGCAEQLQPLQRALRALGHEAHILNFSGHGGTPFRESSFGIEAFAEDVGDYLDSIDTERVDIFGYSMGGYVATRFAFRYPSRVRRIVTLGTKFDWDPESARREVSKVDPEKIAEKVPAFARVLKQRHAPNDWKLLLRKTAAMMEGLGHRPLLGESELSRLKSRVLVLLGDQDNMADRAYSEKVASLITDGRFLLLNETPHPLEKVDLDTLVRLIENEFGDSKKSDSDLAS